MFILVVLMIIFQLKVKFGFIANIRIEHDYCLSVCKTPPPPPTPQIAAGPHKAFPLFPPSPGTHTHKNTHFKIKTVGKSVKIQMQL